MTFLINFFLTIFSFFISKYLIKLFILKLKENFIDLLNFRSMHVIPTPSGAGIIFVSITITSSLICLFINGYSNIYIIPILCLPLALVGILDDLYKISSSLRYLIHIFLEKTFKHLTQTFETIPIGNTTFQKKETKKFYLLMI